MTKGILEGQTALVTGASSGIGAAVAVALGAAGARVVANYRSSKEGAEETVHLIESQGGTAVAVQADVSKPEDCERLFKTAVAHFGELDIFVGNAGIQQDASFTELTLERWRKVIDVNLTGQFLCAQHATQGFRRRGIQPQRSAALGKIIFVSSVHQAIPWAGHVNYASAKGGLKLLMETMAQELAGEKIRVNAVAPGAIKTAINRESWDSEEAARELCKLIPYARIGEPEDVAKAVVWLASDESDYVVGTTLFIDGGMMLYPAFGESG